MPTSPGRRPKEDGAMNERERPASQEDRPREQGGNAAEDHPQAQAAQWAGGGGAPGTGHDDPHPLEVVTGHSSQNTATGQATMSSTKAPTPIRPRRRRSMAQYRPMDR